MSDLNQFIIQNTVQGKIDKKVGAEILKKLMVGGNKTASKDIAIIGMAVKLPMAEDVDSFWMNLVNRVDCIRDFPEKRKADMEELLNMNFNYEDRNFTYKKGGYLDDIDKFDYKFFNLSPLEAKLMDPNQRLFMQTAYKAIEDAGYGGDGLVGTNTGVFVGYSSWSVYGSYIMKSDPSLTGLSIPGNMASIISGRLSYLLDLKGPSIMVDTACSSSLVAIYLACKSIRNGDCEQALAGGVRINFLPVEGAYETGIESKTNKTKTFDDDSDGTTWGEGTAVIVLKPLSKALEDKDNIYAVIKGIASNQDGTSISITAPNALAQKEVILKAWDDAGIDPETISYIEAHGTGTKLGDPVEIAAISKAFAERTLKKQFCAVGSVKTNIGHLDNTAGAAALIKSALALKHRTIPASLHFNKPNRAISFEQSPVYVSDKTFPWETEAYPRRCGVSSFGFSGTNCHIVMEEAPCEEKNNMEENTTQVFTLSAKSKTSFAALIESYKKYLRETECRLSDLCFTTCTGRGHYEYRLAIVAGSLEELKKKLEALDYSITEGYEDTENKVYLSKISSEDEVLHYTNEAGSKLERLIASGKGDLNIIRDICSLYVKGAQIDWKEFYAGSNSKRISLPTYAFEQNRCWFNREKSLKKPKVIDRKCIKHPLLEELLSDSINQKVYITEFSSEKHWVLDEHRIMGNCVVPGTTYLEMMRAGCSLDFPGKEVFLSDVYFIEPLVVGEGEYKEVQTLVSEDADSVEIIIASKTEEGKWIKHAEGHATCEEKAKSNKKLDLEAIRKVCKEKAVIDMDLIKEGPVKFGPRWNNICDVYVGNDEFLCYFEMKAEYLKDLEEYFLHPALMDCAVNTTNGNLGGSLYLPLAYKTLRVYGSTPGRFYSYIKRKNFESENQDRVSFDIALLNQDGTVFAEAEEYTVKKVDNASKRFRDLAGKADKYYETVWVPKKLEAQDSDLSGETILVLGTQTQILASVVDLLGKKGSKVLEAYIGDSYLRLSDNKFVVRPIEEDYVELIKYSVDSGLTKVIHLSIPEKVYDIKALHNLENMKRTGILSLFCLVKAFYKSEVKNNLELILVADYASEVNRQEEYINPYSNAFLSMGKVIGSEFSNLRLRCIDIDKEATAEDLYSEMAADYNTYLASYRDGKRYVEEFKELNLEEKASEELKFSEQGVYIITGGLGGIGIEMGKYLSGKGVANICLISRKTVPDAEKWEDIIYQNEDIKLCNSLKAISEMRKAGTNVVCISADVSNPEQMGVLISNLKTEFGRINGIMHAAGVAGDGFIINKKEDTFRNVIAPKVDGTLILDSLTEDENMDFFVVFSSIVSITGGPGQGDYTAANSFLDAFSDYRNKKGKKTLAINWTAWKETGMSVDFGINHDGVFKVISTEDAIYAFDTVLGKRLNRVVIAEPNYQNAFFDNEAFYPIRLSEEISSRAKKIRDRSDKSMAKKEKNRQTSIKLIGKHEENYTEMERKIGEILGGLLGVEELDVNEDFFTLGVNSLLALKLETEMEKNNIPIEYSDVSLYPTVIELARYVERDATTLLQGMQPFNDLIYRGCFYSAFFPSILYFEKSIKPFLANDVSMYCYSEEDGFYKLEIHYEARETLEQICQNLGLNITAKHNCTDLIDNITASIASNKPVLICVDCYYESIRPDTYMKTHWPHCLLIYGFDVNKKEFHVLEHRNAGSFVYEERTISYSDIVNSYKGYIEHFGKSDIRSLGFSKLCQKEGEIFPTYFEVSLFSENVHYKDTDYAKIYADNMISKKAEVIKGLSYLEDFGKQFEDIALNEESLRKNVDQILNVMNVVINAKRAEIYKLEKLYTDYSEVEEILKSILSCWDLIRVNLLRFMHTSKYKESKIIECIDSLKQIHRLETMYTNKLYLMLEAYNSSINFESDF